MKLETQLLYIFQTYPDYKLHMENDRLKGMGAELSPKAGKEAFAQIDRELLAYNERVLALPQEESFSSGISLAL